MDRLEIKKGFFVIHKYSQRIEFICRILEFLLNNYPELVIKINGKIPRTDLERMSIPVKKGLFGLSGNFSLLLNIENYHMNKIILYRYLPYELFIHFKMKTMAEFPLSPQISRIFYSDITQFCSLEKLLTELEYKRIISGFENKNYLDQ